MQILQKRAITLLEIMIVIFLIGLIGGVMGYNMKGSLEKGKAFKTEQAINQIRDILLLEYANGGDLTAIANNPKIFLENSGLVKDVDALLKDGWGQPFKIVKQEEPTLIKVSSHEYDNYKDRVKAKEEKAAKASETQDTNNAQTTTKKT
ncbi:MAG: type II secretion system protein [Chlamydiae bacterium]|nr:type II secretion system protein [Chlamydiota bacterium]